MLSSLHIRNYALIRELDISFEDGLSVLTGETGAGKSIILGALGLVMGGRADSKSISDGEQKCVIEAEFLLDENDSLRKVFGANDIDYDKTCIIRRELTAAGKSRAFVNDSPVSLSVLKEIADMLIDIHSQHENLLLKDDKFQLSILDTVSQNQTEKQNYEKAYNNYVCVSEELRKLQEKAKQSRGDYDYMLFQYNQLSDAKIRAGEERELEEEQEILEHAEEIKSSLMNVVNCLSDENGALVQIKESLNALRRINDFLPKDLALAMRVESVSIELRDIADEAERIAGRTEFDPLRLQQVEERLDLINSLLEKHHRQTTEELRELEEEYRERLKDTDSFDEAIEQLKFKQNECLQELKKKARLLTESRQRCVPYIKQTLEKQLNLLGVKHARIDVMFADSEYTSDGADNVQLMFAANLNQQLHEVAQVASGGEIARLMLCIKALIANQTNLQTVVFDEIDTGVSGEVAGNMGRMLCDIAQNRQVICITHLPQIASKGKQHFKVYKSDTEDRTETHIRVLGDDERVREIASLLSGENITQAALQNAKELMERG